MSELVKNTNQWQIFDGQQFIDFEGVSTMGHKDVYQVTFDDDSTVEASANHVFFTPDGRDISVKELDIGLVLLGQPNKQITAIDYQGVKQTYDIIESQNHTFLSNGILSHNCQFLSNDALLFNSLTLTNMTPQVEKRQPIFQEHGVFFWKRPIPGNTYLVGVDPATGSGNDFTVIEVFEFPSMEQVAEFRSNTMSSSEVYPILKKLLLYLEHEETIVFFSVENNGVGEGIIALYETDDSPPRFTEMASEEGKNRQGMNTTGKKKIRACLSMKEMVDKELITVCSNTLLQEMKDFVHRKQSYEAKNGSTDDCIAATLIVIRLLEEIATYDQDAYETLYDVGDLEGGFEGEEYDYDDDDDAFTFIM